MHFNKHTIDIGSAIVNKFCTASANQESYN